MNKPVSWIRLLPVLALILVGAGISTGVLLARRPNPEAVQQEIRVYIESMAVAGKIVLVETRDQLVVSQTTPGLLFGNSEIGRFFGLRSDATIEASAWADTAYAIDLYATEHWSIRYNPAGGGTLYVAAPPLIMLPPSIHTDTIAIKTVNRSLFLDETRLEEMALRGLSARFVEAAAAAIDSPELRQKAAGALEALVRLFTDRTGIELARIDIVFAPAED